MDETEEESRCSSVRKKRHFLLRTPVAGEGTCTSTCVQTQSSLRIHMFHYISVMPVEFNPAHC